MSPAVTRSPVVQRTKKTASSNDESALHERLASVRSRHSNAPGSVRQRAAASSSGYSSSRSDFTTASQIEREKQMALEMKKVFRQVEKDVGFNMDGKFTHHFKSRVLFCPMFHYARQNSKLSHLPLAFAWRRCLQE